MLLLARPAAAQVIGGRNVELGVTVVELTRQGDTTTITYVLTIEPTSAEALAAFTVEAPSVVEVSHPLPPQDWLTAMQFRGFIVARWAVLSAARLAAGSESPPLTFRAVGAPGIVDARVTGYYEEIHGDAESTEEDPFLAHSSVMRVVGIIDAPDRTTRGLIERVRRELDEACALGWLRADTTCETLRADLALVLERAGEGVPRAVIDATDTLIAHLDAARGGSMGESAYQLFKANAELIAERAGR